MRDSRVEEVEHVSDSDEEDNDLRVKGKKTEFTVGIFPNHQGATYLLMDSKQEKVFKVISSTNLLPFVDF